jgi:hypothetical protein
METINPMELDRLCREDFLPLLHSTFAIRLSDGEDYLLELVEAEDLGQPPFPGARQPFSLIFSNPLKTAYLEQRIYSLNHPGLEGFSVFLVPLGPDASGMRYQTVFS